MRPPRSEAVGLTKRELEVLNLVVRGHTTTQIAEHLFVSPNTVKKHLAHVFAKCGVRNRVELATWWTLRVRTPLSQAATQPISSEASTPTRSPRAKRVKMAAALLAGFAGAVLAVLLLFAQDRSATTAEREVMLADTTARPVPNAVEGCRCPDNVLIAVLQGPGAGAPAGCPPVCATAPPGDMPE
jgi:DNA-binding CsgD family transcriptional regulator